MATAKHELLSPNLYDADFYSWAVHQGALLRESRFAELDLPNLIDEVEALARKEASELENRYETLLQHLLKWEFQADKRSSSWLGTIRRERRKIAKQLRRNPGLKPQRWELLASAYEDAREEAALETGLPLERFPISNPYSLEETMDSGFWPGGQELPAPARGRRR